MPLLQTIYALLDRLRPPLDRLPFEELAKRYAREPDAVFEEFHRRLNRIVFHAAEEYVDGRHGTGLQPDAMEAMIEEMTLQVFERFAPQFARGAEDMLLCRFARVIREVLGNEAFESIAWRYYYQLPIYYIENKDQRRYLSACYEMGLKPPLVKQISERFMVTVAEADRIIEAANQSLKEIVANDFEPQELAKLTEGYVQ
jgi:hypothetical protein